jgi:methylamine dehydrogenase accessory protein MauD
MANALTISVVLLWIAVLALALTGFALARQIGVLYERIAPVGALSLNPRLKGGAPAPVLDVVSLTGQHHRIGDSGNNQLLLFVSPGCPVCKTLLPIVRSIQHSERAWLSVILASDGEDDTLHREFVHAEGLDQFPYVRSEVLGRVYGVTRLPYAVLIDEKGVISGLGLVNSREHLESLLEARRLRAPTLQAFLEQQPLRMQQP